MKLRFDSIYYYVRDLERSIGFYTQVLGLPLQSRDLVARLDVDGVLVELVPTSASTRLTGLGNARLCFLVDDARREADELKARGVSVGPVLETPQGLLVAFHDPDGNELALWQYADA